MIKCEVKQLCFSLLYYSMIVPYSDRLQMHLKRNFLLIKAAT